MAFRDFPDYRAVARLNALAECPHDLTAPDGLTVERITALRASSCGFDLLYATQRVSDEVMDALQALADEAGLVETFRAMKGGAVLNRIEGFDSENRQVLHTASRDVFAEPPAAPEASARAYMAGLFDNLGRIARQSPAPFGQLREEYSTRGGLNEQVHRDFAAAGGSAAMTQALDSVLRRIRGA